MSKQLSKRLEKLEQGNQSDDELKAMLAALGDDDAENITVTAESYRTHEQWINELQLEYVK